MKGSAYVYFLLFMTRYYAFGL